MSGADDAAVLRFRVDGVELPLALLAEAGLGLTPREHGLIRRTTGISGTAEIGKALQRTDLELLAVLCHIAAARLGQTLPLDRLLDGEIDFDVTDQEQGAASPPELGEDAAGAATPSSPTSTTLADGGIPSSLASTASLPGG